MRNRFALALAFPFFFAMGMRGLLAQAPWPTPDVDPTGHTGALKAQVDTGGGYDAHSGNATRSVTDLHVPGALGVYGLDFTRHWNSLRNDNDNPYAVWPTDFGASGWSHSWGWSALYSEDVQQVGGEQIGSEQIYTTAITITFPDGHANKYKITRSSVGHPPAPPDPRCGPPYSPGETTFQVPGAGVHDRLCDMASNGSTFWLYLADGGAVHFVGGTSGYQATEVFDPQGLHTDLHYDATSGLLSQVLQEGGRWLTITWRNYTGWAAPVIARVETGGYAGSQYVDYKYARFPDQNGHFLTLIRADYPNDPAPGQIASARYTYGTCYGDEPCSPGPQSSFPLLKVADDPRFAGPMRTIRYNYRGTPCQPTDCPGSPVGEPYPNARFDFFYAQAESHRGGEKRCNRRYGFQFPHRLLPWNAQGNERTRRLARFLLWSFLHWHFLPGLRVNQADRFLYR